MAGLEMRYRLVGHWNEAGLWDGLYLAILAYAGMPTDFSNMK